jgi:hypothetical protein
VLTAFSTSSSTSSTATPRLRDQEREPGELHQLIWISARRFNKSVNAAYGRFGSWAAVVGRLMARPVCP